MKRPAGMSLYHLAVLADPENTLPEENELNNDDFLLTRRPDLVVIASTAVGDIFPGGSVKVSTTIRNQGLGAAGQVTAIEYYLSEDKTFDPGDRLVGADTLPKLDSAKSTTLETTFSCPMTWLTGEPTTTGCA